MVKEKKLRFCVVGVGNVALKYGIAAINNSGVSEVVVCVDHGIAKKEVVTERFGLPFELSLSDAIKNHEFDAVYVSVPTAFHKEVTLEAAANSKHILCEKPLASNLAEAEIMLAQAKANKVALFEGFMYRFHSQHAFANKLIEEGRVGKVFQLNVSFAYPRRPEGDFRLDKKKGGGVLLDAGCYTIHFARNFYGLEPTKVFSTLYFENDVDIRGNVLMEFGEGKTAHLSFGMDNHYKNQYEIIGDRGLLRVERAFSVSNEYIPLVSLENAKGMETFELEPDNHFENEIGYFVENINNAAMHEDWRWEALAQAGVMERVANVAK